MDDLVKKVCKICNVEKLRIRVGFFGNKERRCKRWVDETGLLWNGNWCPSCHKEKIKNNVKEKRRKNKELKITAKDGESDEG